MDYSHLAHSAYRVSNMEAALDFYCNKLGLKQAFTLMKDDGTPWLTYLRVAPEQFIELFYWEKPVDNTHAAHMHCCLVVKDIEKAAAELHEKGVKIWYGPSYFNNPAPVPFVKQMSKCGTYPFFVVDPDGNQIEVQEFTDVCLQRMTDEELAKVEPLVRTNTYVDPEGPRIMGQWGREKGQ